MRTARAAGWRRADLWWERLQEAAHRDWRAGERGRALRRFRLARWLAELAFVRDDPRLATSLANAGFATRARNAPRAAERLQARAHALWAGVAPRAADLEIRPRARSSLYHLRLEVRHWETYQGVARARLAAFAAEAGASLEAQARGAPAPHDLYARWRGEKPAAFDDARKFLSACLLIATDDGPGPDRNPLRANRRPTREDWRRS